MLCRSSFASCHRLFTYVRSIATVAALAAIGCSAAKLPPQLDVDEEQYLFDTVYGASTTHTFVFRNPGGLPTAVLAAELSGDTHSFRVVNDDCTSGRLSAGGQCTIDVVLANDLADEYKAQLIVRDVANHLFASAAMSGKVAPASLMLQSPGATVARGSSGAATVTVTNAGGARSGSLKATSENGAIAPDACSGQTLAGGESCLLSVSIATTLTQASAPPVSVKVVDDKGIDGTTAVDFTLVDPGTLSFSGLDLGKLDPVAQWGLITIKNPGPETTDLLQISIVDVVTDPGLNGLPAFAIADNQCTTLAPGASCMVHVGLNSKITVGSSYEAQMTVSAANIHPVSGTVKVQTVHNSGVVIIKGSGSGTGVVVLVGDGSTLCSVYPMKQSCDELLLLNGTMLSFTAIAAAGSTFAGWSGGGCGGSSPTCTVKMANSQDVTITAAFN